MTPLACAWTMANGGNRRRLKAIGAEFARLISIDETAYDSPTSIRPRDWYSALRVSVRGQRQWSRHDRQPDV